MKVFRIINKIFSFLYFIIKFQHLKASFLFAHYQVPFSAANTLKRNGHNIEFLFTGNLLPFSHLEIFKHGLATLIKVLNCKEAKIEEILPKGFKMSFNGLFFKVLSVPNIATIKEVFIENIYNIKLPNQGTILIDIGLNVGYASLYFSLKSEIEHIYAYEPFESTFEEANENINLNSFAKSKITTINLGISNNSGTVEVPLLESGSAVGSTNINFIEKNQSILKTSQSALVSVISIIDILQQLQASNSEKPIFIKMDCEGEEYNILDAIEKNGFFDNIAGFIIEWHIKGPESIIHSLANNNYTILHFPRHIDIGVGEAETGMIYAFKL